MFRKIASTSLATLLIGAAVLTAASVATAAPAAAYDGRYERYSEGPRPGWRPPPPAMHGYWGHRQWRRHHDGYGFRAPPPPYGYGWR